MLTDLVVGLAERSDPANLGLLAVVWWRINRRLRRLESRLSRSDTQ